MTVLATVVASPATVRTARSQDVGTIAYQPISDVPPLRVRSESPFDQPVHVLADPLIDIIHVSADVKPMDARGGLDISLLIDLTVAADSLGRLAFPARGLTIRQAHVVDPISEDSSGVESESVRPEFLAADDSVFVFFDAVGRGGSITVRIDYLAPEGTVVRSTLADSGGCCAWTNGMRSGGDPWLPVTIDTPDRFTAEIRVQAAQGLTPVAGGRRNRTRGTFQYDRPTRADQIVLFVASGAPDIRPSRRRTVAYYGVEGRSEALSLFHRDFDAALDLMERATGFALPYDTLRVAFAPAGPDGFGLAGMVGAGVVVADPALLANTKARLAVDPVPYIGRLAARLWSGASLSVSTWTDAWVTEALAEWLAGRFVTSRSGESEASAFRLRDARAYLRESDVYRRPLVWDRWEHPSDLLDAHASARGAGFLYMTQGLLGDAPFGAGIRRLFSGHANGDVDTEDLRDALEGASGRNLGSLFDAWVYGAGHPVIDFVTRFDPNTDRLEIELEQVQDGPLVPSSFPLETDVRWMTLAGDGSTPVVTRENRWTHTTMTGIEPRFVVLDADRRLTAEIRTQTDLTSLTALLRYGPSTGRPAAAEALAAFADDPALPLAIRLALDQETSPVIRRRLAGLARHIPAGGSLEGLIRRAWADADPGVRLAAVNASRVFSGRPDWEAFVRDQATRDSSAAVMATAVEVLAFMRSPDARYIAQSAIITPSYGELVRKAGFRVLAKDSTVTAAERRDAFLEHTTAGRPDDEIIGALELVRPRSTERALRDRLVDLLDHPSFRVRHAAAIAIGRLLEARDLRLIERILAKEKDPAVRRSLQATLTALRDE